MTNMVVKMTRKVMSLLITLLVVCATQIVGDAEQVKGQRVLYLATGKSNNTETELLLEGFKLGLNSEHEVYVEYLGNTINEVRKDSEKLKKYFSEVIKTKYMMHGGFDVVVCEGDFSAKLVLENYDLFKGTKIGMLNIKDQNIIEKAKVMGVKIILKQDSVLESNIDFINNMYESEKKITVIVGPKKYNQEIIKEFEQLKKTYLTEGVEIELVTLSYEESGEITKLKESLRKGSVVLVMNSTFDNSLSKNSIYKTRIAQEDIVQEIIKQVSEVKGVHIYSDVLTSVEVGAYGGVSSDLNNQGSVVAKEILDIDKLMGTTIYSSKTSEIQSVDLRKTFCSGVKYDNIPSGTEKLISGLGGVYKYDLHQRVLIVMIILMVLCLAYIVGVLEKEKRRNEEMSALRLKAEQVNKIKDSLLSNISHEFKTPVNVIYGASQILEMKCKKDLKENEGILSNVNTISQNSYRLMRLINNVIDVSKIESDIVGMDKQNIEVIGFIEDVVMSVIPFANKKDLELVFDTELEELIMSADVNKLDRIILNLLSNAIKFTNRGGKISVEVAQENGYLQIKVTDTGIGIAEEKLDVIFEKFTQVDTGLTRLNEGSGIGLTIVKTFVELSEGYLDVKSRVGRGTTFIVELPIKLIEGEDIKYIVERDSLSTKSELSDIYL